MKNPQLAELEIHTSETEDSADALLIHEKLRDQMAIEVGPSARKPLTMTARQTSSSELIGGLKGVSHWNWLYISHLWVAETHRSKKIGQKLIEAAVVEAKRRTLTGLYVDTFSDRARTFYLTNGFQEFGQIVDFPPGQTRFYLLRRI